MEYDDKVQMNRIELKIDAIFRKVCPELVPKEEVEDEVSKLS